MPWTPLHAALGQTGNDLTFEMIEDAVEEGVEERADLDWKTSLPLTQTDKAARQAQGEELAKDVAAMANSGGGLIVYGVAERSGNTSAAGEIRPVGEVGETELRTIRQIVNNQIYPPVTALELIRLTPIGAQKGGVLAALVQPSLDVPHLLHQRGNHEWFQAPWRDGPETRRMTERQLADAYRLREQRRHEQETSFEQLYNDLLQTLGTTSNSASPTWVVGVAQPIQPRPDARRLSAVATERFLKASQQVFNAQHITPLVETRDEDVRTGLRRYFKASSRKSRSHTLQSRVEVYGDGTLTVAFTRDGLLGTQGGQRGHIPIDDLEHVTKDLISMILHAVESGSISSDYRTRIGVSPRTQVFRRPDSSVVGEYQPFDERTRVNNHHPVDGIIVTQFGRVSLLNSAAELLTDVLGQVGSPGPITGTSLDRAIQLTE
ncbi:AlbA family DNA-binding domain-containing protein [Arthrobacter pigmenti]